MKVIRHGEVVRFKCAVCGCRYVAGINEVTNCGFYLRADCPECGSWNKQYDGSEEEEHAGGDEQAAVQEAVQGGADEDRG